MRRRGWARLCAAIGLALLLTGCWDSRDPKTMDLAVGLGFQRSGSGYSLLAQVPTATFMRALLPGAAGGGGGESGPSAFVLNASGPTVPIALHQMDPLR